MGAFLPVRPIRSLVVFGTRPEAIKMAPVIRSLAADRHFDLYVAVTGQHREMLDHVLKLFDIVPDFDLKVMERAKSLEESVVHMLLGLGPVFERVRPQVTLVHGDTTSTFAGALASFYKKVPVAHVEAGLRSGDPHDPFPEEMDRRLTGTLAMWHFAPTMTARQNLLKENVEPQRIFVTGNTVIDALMATLSPRYTFADERLAQAVTSGRRLLVVTTHRRENWGEPLKRICAAVGQIVSSFEDVEAVVALHPNPAVADTVRSILAGRDRITLVDSPPYGEFLHLLQASYLIITDSGGLQEEAPALGKPVLVVRETIERPEGVRAGTVLPVGTHTEAIVASASNLLNDSGAYAKVAQKVNPYGDGQAAKRVHQALLYAFGLGPRPADFRPDPA